MVNAKKTRWHQIVIYSVGAVACVMLGIGVCMLAFRDEEVCDKNLTFVNEDVRCNRTDYVLDKREYVTARILLEEYLLREKNDRRITRYAVYFRDLENGPLFGINEKDGFVPASLMKLPVMLTYLTLAEEDPTILDLELAFVRDGQPALEQYFVPPETVQPNTAYTVRELLRIMIAHSDNNAYEVLLQHLYVIDPAGAHYLDTMRELGLVEPTGNLVESLTAKQYASIFRTLYNGSFLTSEYSNLALDMLSQSSFDKGLVAGISDDIAIAHKFGERFGLPDNQKELHDCGVVYYPKNAYLVCIMVEGYEFPVLSTVIRNVSDMIYDEVDSRRL